MVNEYGNGQMIHLNGTKHREKDFIEYSYVNLLMWYDSI